LIRKLSSRLIRIQITATLTGLRNKDGNLKGIIALEDGTVFEGESFGAKGEEIGEVVFNTSMTGYQEILTDPSYSSQIVTMTYPLIGNYGINDTTVESSKIQVSGLIVREACFYPSNFTSQKSLPEYLQENGIIGIHDIDTRALTRHIRLKGAMKGVIFSGDEDVSIENLVEKAKNWCGLNELDLVKNVTCEKPWKWSELQENKKNGSDPIYSVVAIDFGIKYNILRILESCGCDITIVPAHTDADEILGYNPDGIFLSNGPGDPSAVTYAVETISKLIGKKPIFGICLGHQLLSLALGGKTYKLKFGHRGANHPVRSIDSKIIEIVSQNHGFCVDFDSLDNIGVSLSHLNLNDKTCEGIEDEKLNLLSVQYHPEASPGPHDSAYLFTQFTKMMEKSKTLSGTDARF
jgi:carbamoyl-phosphate synthase small subunit